MYLGCSCFSSFAAPFLRRLLPLAKLALLSRNSISSGYEAKAVVINFFFVRFRLVIIVPFGWLQHIANLAGYKDVMLPIPAYNIMKAHSHPTNKLAVQVGNRIISRPYEYRKKNFAKVSIQILQSHSIRVVIAGIHSSSCWSSLDDGCYVHEFANIFSFEGGFIFFLLHYSIFQRLIRLCQAFFFSLLHEYYFYFLSRIYIQPNMVQMH